MITWNQAAFITQAIESVLAQRTDFPFELVIGEDCSTDGTREIVVELQRQFPGRIRLLLNPVNTGWRENSLRTFSHCQGEYVALLEGDDFWTDPFKLQDQVALMRSEPSAFLCGARALIWKDGDEGPSEVTPPEPSNVLATYGARELLEGKWWFRTCTKMFRRKHIQETPAHFLDKDWAGTLWLVAHTNFGPVCFLDRVVGVYREHPGGVWSSLPRHERVLSDIHELYALVPVFKPPERAYLRDLLARNAQELVSTPEVTAQDRVIGSWLATVRNPRDPSSWRRLARSLRLAVTGWPA